MRLLILALLFSVFSYGQEITTVHFNYKWNENNSFSKLDRLKSTKVQYAFVEDQSDNIKKSIKVRKRIEESYFKKSCYLCERKTEKKP